MFAFHWKLLHIEEEKSLEKQKRTNIIRVIKNSKGGVANVYRTKSVAQKPRSDKRNNREYGQEVYVESHREFFVQTSCGGAGEQTYRTHRTQKDSFDSAA